MTGYDPCGRSSRAQRLNGDGFEPLEFFTEPNVALSLASRLLESAVVRIHLSLESKPPWLDSQSEIFEFFVSLDLALTDLAKAAAEWDRELGQFPAR